MPVGQHSHRLTVHEHLLKALVLDEVTRTNTATPPHAHSGNKRLHAPDENATLADWAKDRDAGRRCWAYAQPLLSCDATVTAVLAATGCV